MFIENLIWTLQSTATATAVNCGEQHPLQDYRFEKFRTQPGKQTQW
jgi:hypothetical protein